MLQIQHFTSFFLEFEANVLVKGALFFLNAAFFHGSIYILKRTIGHNFQLY